jgi:hypothetical protein
MADKTKKMKKQEGKNKCDWIQNLLRANHFEKNESGKPHHQYEELNLR